MIESRYKIEYVLPENDLKKTSPFRVLWYLLLIPLIAAVVVGITYDFSVKDISQDSMVLLEKAKVHVFNLGDASKLAALEENNVEKSTVYIKNKQISKPDGNKPVDVKPMVASVESNKVVANKGKTTIFELSAAQKLQLKTIQDQIAKNTELTATLDSLSEQLVQEQTKNLSLNSQLAAQEQDRLELEQEYNNAIEKSEGSKISVDKTATSTDKTLAAQEKDLELIDRDLPPVIPAIPVTTNTTITLEVPNKTIESKDKKIVEKSETDKIIEAMATVNSFKNAKESVTVKKSLEATIAKKTPIKSDPVKDLPEDVVINTEQVLNAETETKEIKKASAAALQAKVTEPVTIEPAEVFVSVDFNEEKTIAVKNEIKAVEKELEVIEKTIEKETVSLAIKEVKPEPISKPKEVSSVDAIIAAMQGVKSDVTKKPSNSNGNSEKKSAETANQ